MSRFKKGFEERTANCLGPVLASLNEFFLCVNILQVFYDAVGIVNLPAFAACKREYFIAIVVFLDVGVNFFDEFFPFF